MFQIYRDAVAALGYNLDVEIANYTQALIAFSSTVGLPAPTTYELVEVIVREHGGLYQIIEPESGLPPNDPQSFAVKIAALNTQINAQAAVLTSQSTALANQSGALSDQVNAFINPPDTPRTLALKTDAGRAALLTLLQAATPAQIDAWLTTNMTSLAQARTVLAALIKLVAVNLPSS